MSTSISTGPAAPAAPASAARVAPAGRDSVAAVVAAAVEVAEFR